MFARLARFIALITLLPLAVLAAPAATPITAIPKVTVAGQAVGTNTAGLTLNTCPKYIVIEAPGLGDKGGGWTGPTTAGILNGLSGGLRYTLKWVVLLCLAKRDQNPATVPQYGSDGLKLRASS